MANVATRRVALAIRAAQQKLARFVDRNTLPGFANAPQGFEMKSPRSFVSPRLMTIGTDVKIGANSEFKCQTSFPGGWMRHPEGAHVAQTFTPTIAIGDRVTATASLQLVAFESIVIEDDVMFAANVFVADGTHAFATADVPYKFQGIFQVAPVRIGRGSWIGQNAVITPGVTIGELAIVGANSVVTRDVAPRTMVAGVPARIVRRWDEERSLWARPERGE